MNNLNDSPDSVSNSTAPSELQATKANFFNKLGIRTKTTILAVALGTLPILGIGATTYYFADQSLTNQITGAEEARSVGMADKLNRFMGERYGDIQVMAKLPILSNPKVRAATTAEEKVAVLNSSKDIYRVYDSIAVFDLKGNPLLQSQGKVVGNHADRDYFQQALKTGKPVISQPKVSKSTKEVAIYVAAPIKDTVTGETIAIVRARMPIEAAEEVIKNFSANGEQYHVVDASGEIFLALNKDLVGEKAEAEYASFARLKSQGKAVPTVGFNNIEKTEQLIAYAPFGKLEGLPELNWDAIISVDTDIAFAPQKQLLFTLLIGTGIAAILVGAIAAYAANRATRPILLSTDAVKKLGQGEFDTRIVIEGEDELAQLGANINQMAGQIQTLLAEQQEAAEQEKRRNQELQQELIALLSDVQGASEGDLTVRAEVSAGEIGIVADFFNSIVENLRDIVTQVKQAASQVNSSIGENEGAISELADEAIEQASQITQTLNSVEEMTRSIQQVAGNAQTAAEVARTASNTAQVGGTAMDRTVESILQLRETVAETAKKVKRLGEASQQISKVISLINEIALKTNLLAVNASIEAARAGEEGRGFAVVAEEVGQLAAQSASATKEIERIVETIQLETSEVVEAMELGTTQVVAGTRLVEETKQSLAQIVDVSRQIDQLVASISTATDSQAQTSKSVTELMEQIAMASERASNSSRQVSSALQDTVGIAQQLQDSVGTFKVA
ncbi:MAG: HAMP domain-containing protein [Cyanosarcina radialis HA8281-LM2]|jgi:twitching motility protein PilJ|nr:HAMP domain-containing protein [Cyanosarcina radialis HA8281-LM2]